MDDWSRKLFPVGQMISAYLRGDNYGFQVIDDNYLDIVDNKLVGTLGIGSRYSEFFVRIYTKRKLVVRWETELKQKEAQKAFVFLATLAVDETDASTSVKTIKKALIDAAYGKIDFRDNRYYTNKSHARKDKTERLPFWQEVLNKIDSLIENLDSSNH